MVWVARRQTYAGSSLLGLDEREATAFHTIVLLRCLYWPIPPYTNKEYNPDKGVYGRLTELRRSIEYETIPPLGAGGSPLFVENDKLIHFTDNVIYDKTIPLARIQRLYGEGMLKLLDELDDPDIPPLVGVPKKKALLKVAYWISTALDIDDEFELEGEYAIAAHGNRKWALSTHPESIWEWTVLAFLSDFLSTTEEEDDPSGENPDAPESPTDEPPAGLPPGGIDTDVPPVGTPPGWFEEPPEEPGEPEYGTPGVGGYSLLLSYSITLGGVAVSANPNYAESPIGDLIGPFSGVEAYYEGCLPRIRIFASNAPGGRVIFGSSTSDGDRLFVSNVRLIAPDGSVEMLPNSGADRPDGC